MHQLVTDHSTSKASDTGYTSTSQTPHADVTVVRRPHSEATRKLMNMRLSVSSDSDPTGKDQETPGSSCGIVNSNVSSAGSTQLGGVFFSANPQVAQVRWVKRG